MGSDRNSVSLYGPVPIGFRFSGHSLAFAPMHFSNCAFCMISLPPPVPNWYGFRSELGELVWPGADRLQVLRALARLRTHALLELRLLHDLVAAARSELVWVQIGTR